MNQFFDELFGEVPVMAILRGLSLERTLEICELAWAGGVRAVEIPVQNEEAYETLAAVIQAARAREAGAGHIRSHVPVVGAGTVLIAEQVDRIADMGAAFAVSPGYDPVISAHCASRGLAHLPGVATASEITQATLRGLRWLKAFPARELGVSWFGAMHGPFPDARFVATGGVGSPNAAALLASGASALSIGSAIASPGELERVLEAVAEVSRSHPSKE